MWVEKNEHIKHVYVEKSAALSACLDDLFIIGLDQARFLIDLGAIYVDKKRTREDISVRPGQYLRVHLYPRRWPAAQVDWAKTVVEETESYLVINKPAGIPVPSSVDNALENACYQLEQHFNRPLYITHRLDRPTRGLFVLAKTKEFQSQFNKLLLDRGISKKYLALSSEKVLPGTLVHYMEDTLTAPKNLSAEPKEKWMRCELNVLTSNPRIYLGRKCYESEIELVTGRTHQIRAQMAFEKAPLLGDASYGGDILGEFSSECIGLIAQKLEFLDKKYSLPGFEFGES